MIKKNAHFEKQNYVPMFFVLFGLIFVRYCYFGFQYYYQLDDYIQYHNYTAGDESFLALVKGLGLLSARPLAGLFDITLWSRFYGHMIVAVALISAMYSASAVFLHKVFSKQFGTGHLFFIVFALLPLGFEGTYWVSASTRIVVGMFFAALSFYFFDVWCQEGKKRSLVLFSTLQLAAFCFYEQIILFSGALTMLVMLHYARSLGRRRGLWGFLMFANAAVYFGFTKLMPTGVYGERAKLFLPWQDNYVEQVLVPLLRQMKEVFVKGNVATLGKGLIRGLKLLVSEPNVIYVLAVLALCVAFYVLVTKTKRDNIRFFAELFSGFFLAIAPLVLFFALKSPWFGARNAVVSFCGLALIADAVFDLIFGRLKSGKTTEAVIVSVLALLLCTASISELYDYRETTLADTKIAKAATVAFEGFHFDDQDCFWLLNVNPSYVSDGNFYFHEHGYGVTSSAWALTGAVSAVSERTDIPFTPLFVPISEDGVFLTDESKIGKVPAYCLTGEALVSVSIVKTESYLWNIISTSGELLGTLQYKDGGLTLRMN